MKILILSAYSTHIKRYAALAVDNKTKYSSKHHYDFINVTDNFLIDREPAWSKIKFIKEHLLNYDYIFWIDADALFMRFDIKLESFLVNNEKYDMIFNLEEWWADTALYNNYIKFNSGVFFIKNSDFSFKFLNEVYNEKYLDGVFWEQSAIWEMYNNNVLDCKNHIKLLPNRTFNSFDLVFTTRTRKVECEYSKGDFICHFAGPRDKYPLMKEYLPRVVE